MEGAGLLGLPPPMENYLHMRPPLFGAPWQFQREMHLMELQYNHPPIFPFGMQSLTTRKRRRRRSRTSWNGNDCGHRNPGIQIKVGKNFNSETSINIEVGSQLANIIVNTTDNSQEQKSRLRIRKQRPSTSINLRLEEQMPNRSQSNTAHRRRNRSLQWSIRRKNLIDGRYAVPFKPGTSPLLRDEGLNIPKTSHLKKTRRFRRRRRNFQNRQNNKGNEQQHRETQVEVTEMDEEDLQLVPTS